MLASLANKEVAAQEGKVQLAGQEAELMLVFAGPLERDEGQEGEGKFQLERVEVRKSCERRCDS